MARLLAGLASAFGLAWLWRKLHGARSAPPQAQPDAATDHASELRAKLEEARSTADDRDDYDAAEGQPLDEVERPPAVAAVPEPPPEQPLSLDERRRAVHEKAQQALGEMDRLGRDD